MDWIVWGGCSKWRVVHDASWKRRRADIPSLAVEFAFFRRGRSITTLPCQGERVHDQSAAAQRQQREGRRHAVQEDEQQRRQ